MNENPPATRYRHVLLSRGSFMVIAVLAGATLIFLASRHLRLAQPHPINRIVIEKSARKLSTFRAGALVKSYGIALGQNPVGPKMQEGDMKTPEGIYLIDGHNPTSDYHLALHISYPSAEDRAQAAARGVDPGSDIEIHGLPNGADPGTFRRQDDWTAGCIAISNEEIEELFRIAPDGTVVEIRP